MKVEDVSKIIKDWVNGESIISISKKYFNFESIDETERVFKASEYVNSQLMSMISWGIDALQKVSAFQNEEINLEKISQNPCLCLFWN